MLRSTPASTLTAEPPLFTLEEHRPLAPLTTFGVGGPARWFARVATEAELAAAHAWAARRGLPVFILGGGSNLLVADEGFPGLVLQVALMGVESRREGSTTIFRVGAGEDWDCLVTQTVEADCAGIECLAGIPGTVGGTPVQNVGAYGQEVAQTIARVRCFDRRTGAFLEFSQDQCGFAYRTSRFNTGADRGRYVVTAVEFHMEQGGQPTLTYTDLKHYFNNQKHLPPLTEVASAVRSIRAAKGMVIATGKPLISRDPDTRSAGSFFKNPIVSEDTYEHIARSVAPAPVASYPAPGGRRKLAAAWLLEQSGFGKGFGSGNARLSSRHPLALTNWSGNATAADILHLRDIVIAGVAERFGITLEQEPVLLTGGTP